MYPAKLADTAILQGYFYGAAVPHTGNPSKGNVSATSLSKGQRKRVLPVNKLAVAPLDSVVEETMPWLDQLDRTS